MQSSVLLQKENKKEIQKTKSKQVDFDVIIVGAGPAGLWCALKLAEGNASVLVLDKKQEIGVPVRCAEALGLGWFERLGLKPEPGWAVQGMYGACLYAPSGKMLEIRFPKVSGYILERKIFEKDLARRAARAGALIKAKCFVSEILKENNFISGIQYSEFGAEKKVFSHIVIAADGFESKIARQAGLNTTNILYHVESGFQYEMAGVEIEHPDLINLYFGNEIAPRGYLWIFPKGKDCGNVGIGIHGNNPVKAKKLLDDFIASKPGLAKGSIIEVNAGGIPVGGFLERMTLNGFMAIGDAAHQVNPIHGGGIGLAMEAGAMAAETALNAIKENNFSDEFLHQYTLNWKAKRGKELDAILQKRMMFEEMSDADFEVLAKSFSGEDILQLAYGNSLKTAAMIAIKLVMHPALIKLITKYLTIKK